MSAKWDPQLIANIVGPYIADHRVTHVRTSDLVEALSRRFQTSLHPRLLPLTHQLITFDATGITRHPNHIALAEVYPLLSPRPRLLELQSPSVATKFTGPFWSLVLAVRDVMRGPRGPRASQSATSSAASASTTTSAAFKQIETDTPPAPRLEVEIAFVASPAQYIAAVRAMLAHSSQLVWFRWLYVAFSHLMWVNELRDASHPLVVA
jgi:N-acetylglucosaminylphosphatidylinositol deacetylase